MDSFHRIDQSSLAIAIVSRTPIGELEASEEDDQKRERAPYQDAFNLHRPNESDRSGREGFHVYASDQQVERECHFTEHDRLNDAEGSIVVSRKHQRDHTED